MAGQAGLLELSVGSVLRLDGTEWTVAAIEAQYGRVLLGAGEDERWRSIRWLAHHRDCQGVPAEAGEDAGPAGQPASLDDLNEHQREVVRLRVSHLLEAETGFRGGDPLHPGPGEPRPAYDPRSTTLGQRRQAKVAELKALGADEAALLGLGQVSERTLKRMAAAWRHRGPAGCIDRRWVRAGGGHPSITEEVREAILAVRAETLLRSRMSMRARYALVAQYVAEKFGPQVPVPCYWTLRAVWLEWFGPGGTRQRYARSAAAVDAAQVHVVVHRPGQVVALDTTLLPVKVRDGVFGEPVSAHLTLALDLFTHSVAGFRLTLVSDTSVDVAMLLRDVMMPLPMREGWGPEMEWPYPGVPASVVASFAGHRVAALPFFAPETVTTDHGSVYKSHALVDAQRVLGCNILPARTLRPQDKAACERAFGALRSLLFEQLPGYTGVDVADRGADPEADAVLTMAQMERLLAEWVVRVWQNRALGEHAPAWGPGEEHSPNTLFAAAMNQGGFALQIPRPELYYELLPAHYVKIHGQRGVKVGGLWYGRSHPALGPYQGKPSNRGGRHTGTWVIRSDRRDRRAVFFQDPADPSAWHVLRWNGLPPEGEVPAFSDKTAGELLREARACGLSPQSDADLLPVLLKILGLATARDSMCRLPAVLLSGIPEPNRRIFARMTRLTDGQVTGLGLAAWQERYPLPAWMPGKRRRLPMDRWALFAPATRYCPECLAGDGSAVQESFGGPWLKAWHLPVVFACPAHQRLLEHRCPECGQAVHVRPGARPAFALLPAMRTTGLHPAQCRAVAVPGRGSRVLPACCGARLDHAGPRQQASPGMLALQGKILRLLDPDGAASTVSAGLPARPGSYFADLRALGLLACSTWPAARHLSPSEETAAAIDQHVASLRQQEAERRAISPASRPSTAPPPLDAAVSAGLAHIADRILAGTPDETRWQIRPLLPPSIREASRTSWGRWVTQSATPCSEGLRTAYEPLLRRCTRPAGQPQGRRSTLLRTHRWGPENVPALIPEDWYARHFTPLPGVSAKLARRTAALRLVQIIAGGSLAEAAEFLGISSGYGPWRRGGGRVYSAAGLARSAARQLPDPLGFETGLASLTRELSAPGTPLVNYQHRRQALEAWSINGDAWPKLAARRTLMARPESGDRKRQIASVYVWVRVTSGERCFAPRPIEAAQPAEVQENWQRSWDVIWRQLLHTSDPRSHYTRFRAELDAFAAALAKTIDMAGHTHLKVAPTKPSTITGDAAIYSWEPDVRQPSMADAS